jgi:hypothetical protein
VSSDGINRRWIPRGVAHDSPRNVPSRHHTPVAPCALTRQRGARVTDCAHAACVRTRSVSRYTRDPIEGSERNVEIGISRREERYRYREIQEVLCCRAVITVDRILDVTDNAPLFSPRVHCRISLMSESSSPDRFERALKRARCVSNTYSLGVCSVTAPSINSPNIV